MLLGNLLLEILTINRHKFDNIDPGKHTQSSYPTLYPLNP